MGWKELSLARGLAACLVTQPAFIKGREEGREVRAKAASDMLAPGLVTAPALTVGRVFFLIRICIFNIY